MMQGRNKIEAYIKETSDLGLTKGEEPEEREVLIAINEADLNIYEMIDKVIRPLLAGFGYAEKSIDKVLGEPQ